MTSLQKMQMQYFIQPVLVLLLFFIIFMYSETIASMCSAYQPTPAPQLLTRQAGIAHFAPGAHSAAADWCRHLANSTKHNVV